MAVFNSPLTCAGTTAPAGLRIGDDVIKAKFEEPAKVFPIRLATWFPVLDIAAEFILFPFADINWVPEFGFGLFELVSPPACCPVKLGSNPFNSWATCSMIKGRNWGHGNDPPEVRPSLGGVAGCNQT
jgi:hypothetical protein